VAWLSCVWFSIMAGTSTGASYEISGDNTEWEDILIKKGITTQESVLLGKGLNPEEVLPPALLSLSLLIHFFNSF
jgi:hypothetical protein